MTAFLGYVLPYGQMSLWGLNLKPQMYNLCLIYFLLFTYGLINKLTTPTQLLITPLTLPKPLKTLKDKLGAFNGNKVIRLRGEYRIGPHNK